MTESEYKFVMNKVREHNPVAYTKDNFLSEVYLSEEDYEHLSVLLKRKKNVILQGAPASATFAAKRLAYSLLGQKRMTILN